MITDPTDAPVDLEFVEDDFTEEQHRKLDQNIISLYSLKEWTTEYYSVFGPVLLRSIKEQLRNRASRSFNSLKDFEVLIREKPVLLGMLEKGAQQGFKSLRCLKILRNNENVIPQCEAVEVEPTIKITTAAERAWNSEYQGRYHMVFQNNINAMQRSANYANCIAIIQSSGYGKSRMVDELAKHVFTIPFNIRKPGEQTMGAYPPSDRHVWEYLCTRPINSVDAAEKVVASFLSNLFLHVANEVLHVFASPMKQQVSEDTFAKQWREHLLEGIPFLDDFGTNRSHLYNKVVLASRKTLTEVRPREELFRDLRKNLIYLLEMLKKCCHYPLDEGNESCVKIFLYFDEAHELGRDIQGGKKFYDAVRSILAQFHQSCVFTVFLSTQSSSMPLLAPSSETSRSSRQQDINVLWGPITETPFDCHPMFPVRPGQYGLAEVSQLTFMIRFGRPLFWTMFEHKEKAEKALLLSGMTGLARKKLLCADTLSDAPQCYSQKARIAIIDVLIHIDYEPRRQSAHDFEMELVASHMRTAFSIPYHRTYLRSGYPSEPFLAEAASRQMLQFMTVNPSYSVVDDLAEILEADLIDLGQKGEVVMRLLLRKAYMAAIVEEQPGGITNFSRGCSFVRFLGALLAPPYDTDVRQIEPNNIVKSASGAKQPLSAVFENAVVRFTHFVKAADDAVMTTRGMAMGFLRGAAIIGWNNQKRVDIAIPILMNKDDKIEEASMSALLIQVKRRHQQGTFHAYIIDAVEINFFTEGATKDTTPYVTIVAELGAKAPRKMKGKTKGKTKGKLKGNVKFDKPPEIASSRIQKKLRPRYGIWAYGCTPKTWKVVNKTEVQSYRHILSLDDLFGDHPRQDEASMDLVYRMLPFWCAGSRLAWFSDESDSTVEPMLVEMVENNARKKRKQKQKQQQEMEMKPEPESEPGPSLGDEKMEIDC